MPSLQFKWKVEFSFHLKFQGGEPLLLSSLCLFMTILVIFSMCYFWVTNNPQISGSQQQRLTFYSQVCGLSGVSVSGYRLSSGLLYLSLILGPVADDYLFTSWKMAKAQDKREHSSTLKSSAQNTPANFPLARASHMAQL